MYTNVYALGSIDLQKDLPKIIALAKVFIVMKSPSDALL